MLKWSPQGASGRPGPPGGLCTCSVYPNLPKPEQGANAGNLLSEDLGGATLGGCPITLSSGAGSAGEAFLSTIQKAAEVVASAMRPGPESPGTQRLLPRGDAYQPAAMPAASHGPPALGNPLPGASPGPRAVRHRPGQAGGGWDELDSGPSSQNSSQNSDLSRASDSGSNSHSGTSRELGDLAERAEVMALSDCQQELGLVRTVTRGPRAFLSREEAQHFIRACGLLNCEAVLQLLTCHLRGTSECTQLRALCAIATLGSADLLPQEHILLRTRRQLQELSMGSPGPVTNKATKGPHAHWGPRAHTAGDTLPSTAARSCRVLGQTFPESPLESLSCWLREQQRVRDLASPPPS
ncbi:hypothetical protein P7K49_012065 [Saguinus oedipus]|uniref:AP-4 complex accessory subunit Tepsin VHS/ENTH-like domain-containing protein n=1 Tax=Saguinus oedipus TaxID=9490 RepID=A0ABQ9VSF5_SAGOE|nr:hypothetical protein P7K49_012065 [Saguinus oedipus]